jgi:hypothetical protein
LNFINPIEILGLQYWDVTKIDSVCIKQAKRKLFAEIDLSENGYLNYGGNKITKADTEVLINELDDKERVEYYHNIANNFELNSFLKSGDICFFSSYREESVFKLETFIILISPFFAEQYDKVLSNAFQEGKINSFKRIITVLPIVTVDDRDKAYKSITILLRQKIKEINEVYDAIKKQKRAYKDKNIDDLFKWVDNLVNVKIINLLPPYFQSLRNQIAKSILNLSVCVNNEIDNYSLAFDIVNYAMQFNTDGLVEQKIAEDYKIILDNNTKRNDKGKNSPTWEKYELVLVGLRTKLKAIKDKKVTGESVLNWIKTSISIIELNSLDNKYDDTRRNIVIMLNSIVSEISSDFSDFNTALQIISFAESIKVDNKTKLNISETKNYLLLLKNKIQVEKVQKHTKIVFPKSQSQKTNTINSKRNNLSSILVILSIFVVVLLIVAIASPRNSIPQAIKSNTNISVVKPDSPVNWDSLIKSIKPKESIYKGNQLENGSSPFDECFGTGVYWQNADANIKFSNGNSYDAVVCLVNVSTGKTIRNEYIRAGNEFTMSKLPSGTYYMKAYFGKDWNPEITNFCGTFGAFETEAHFSKSDNPSDYLEISNTEYSYTTGSITLYAVTGGNMTTKSTTESDFFTK